MRNQNENKLQYKSARVYRQMWTKRERKKFKKRERKINLIMFILSIYKYIFNYLVFFVLSEIC